MGRKSGFEMSLIIVEAIGETGASPPLFQLTASSISIKIAIDKAVLACIN